MFIDSHLSWKEKKAVRNCLRNAFPSLVFVHLSNIKFVFAPLVYSEWELVFEHAGSAFFFLPIAGCRLQCLKNPSDKRVYSN